jgi:hypothetical protein
MSREYKLATIDNIYLCDIEDALTYFKKEDMEEMNKKMKDILDSLFLDCSYRERLVYEDIFKKGFISAFIRIDKEEDHGI